MTATWFGLLLGSQRRLGSATEVYPALRTEAAAAVQLGITRLVAPEHLQAEPYLMLRPWPLLAALRAEIGSFTAVGSVIAGLTSSAQLTGDLSTVGAVGAGPVGVALAAGYRAEDFTAAGRPYEDRFRLRRQLRRAMVESGVVPDGLLWSATATVEAARRATADGADWYCPATTSDQNTAEIGAAVGGRGVLRRDVLIGATDADLRRRWDRYVAPKYGAYAEWGYTDGTNGVLAGTSEQIATRLASLIAMVHPSGIVVRLCWPDMNGSSALDHVHTFGHEVLPAFTQELLPLRGQN